MAGELGAEVQPFLIPYSYSSAVFTSEAYVNVLEVFRGKSRRFRSAELLCQDNVHFFPSINKYRLSQGNF
jgi:hypothetical protein